MILGARRFVGLMLSCVSVLCSNAGAAAAIDPELLRQAMQMPPAQREALMLQLGIQPGEFEAYLEGVDSFRANEEEGFGLRQQRTPLGPSGQDALALPLMGSRYGFPELLMAPEEEEVDLESLDPLEVPYGRRYGLDFFADAPGEFQRLDALAVPDDYALGFGDVLSVSLYGAASNQYELEVGSDGAIFLPKLGPVLVAGLRLAEVVSIIREKVESEVIGAKAAVTLLQPRSVQIQVAGEVEAPGVYLVPSFASLVQILNAAGGLSEIGSLRQITLIKKGKERKFDLYSQGAVAGLSTSINFASGDTIYVPPLFGAARIRGAVKRPGVYEILPSTTIEQLISLAGGKAPAGDLKGILVAGFADDAGAYLEGSASEPLSMQRPLADGDVLYVPSRTRFVSNSVQVRGAVRNQGPVPWKDGMTLRELFSAPEKQLDLEGADLELGVIVRRGVFANELRFIPFYPKALLGDQGDAGLPALGPQDVVLVLPRLSTADLDQLKEARQFQELSAKRQRGEELSPEDQITLYRLENPQEAALGESSPTRFDLLSEYISAAQVGVGAGLASKLVEVRGEVQLPGLYPFLETGRPSDFIRLAGGVKESGDQDRLLLLHRGQAEGGIRSEVVALQRAMESGLVGPGDVLTLPQNSDAAQSIEVEISGEVLSPGKYVVPLGATLSDLLVVSGGVNKEGDLRGAVFSRDSLRKVEAELRKQYLTGIQERLVESALVGDERTADPSVLKYLENLDEAMSQDPLGRLQIDLLALAAGDSAADITLQRGDRLVIPPLLDAVIVAGQVNQPGAFSFREGLELGDYVALAGGASTYGDLEGAYVVGPDGSVRPLDPSSSWLSVGDRAKPLMPGDRIVVPLTANFINRFSLTKDVVQLIYQSGIGLAAVIAAF